MRARTTDWLERAAVGASAACLAHCLALPILFALVPAMSSLLAMPDDIHVWLLAAAAPMAGAALVQGRSVHGAFGPLLAGLTGLALMATGAIVGGEGVGETSATVGGSLILATAHLLNWRKRHACAC